jgi:hypothetical protein
MESAETRKMKTIREGQETGWRQRGSRENSSTEGGALGSKKVTTEKWLAKIRDMIVCPKQPGQLTISKAPVRVHHEPKENLKELLKGTFQYIYMRGLSVCRDCPIGKKLSIACLSARPRPSARPGFRPRPC